MTTANPFQLPLRNRLLARSAESLLGLNRLGQLYSQRPQTHSAADFLDYAQQALSLKVQFQGQPLSASVPAQGATLIVANHPFGGSEGIALARALMSVRPDTKVLTNQLLSRIPELEQAFFSVDVLSANAHSTRRNSRGIRAARQHLQDGGCLLMFPAGQVSARCWQHWAVTDRPWHTLTGWLALQSNATTVPVFIDGQNPEYFQWAGLLHPRLRTLLLPRQLTNKAGKEIQMTVGSAIHPRDYRQLPDSRAVTSLFRMSTYLLASATQGGACKPLDAEGLTPEAVTAAVLDELNTLAPYRLLSKGSFDVYCAPYSRLPNLFPLLAHARELTFRAAGEGTGRQQDSDRFDPHYLHLFVWDREQRAVVGGYRLGRTDQIIKTQGLNGLYSRSLYQYDLTYLQQFGPALEVGRSFVTQAYQRHPSALDLLWRGIGHFVAQNPQYALLFGCVSISSSLSKAAQAFISDAMMESFRAEQKFLQRVKPRIPLRVKGKTWNRTLLSAISDISVFNKLVGMCDPGKTIPVLLRHYLSLNGRFVGFTVNRQFNDSLDGLMVVDMRKVPTRYLKRYLGADITNFNQYWTQHESTLSGEY